MCLGADHQHLFNDDEDFQCLLLTLYRLKMDMSFELHAYALLPDRLHMLIWEKKPGDISLIMKRLMTRYAIYFNRKYARGGAVMSNRYQSAPVAVDEYFLPLIRHIHQSPVQARVASRMEEYAYCSYREYLQGGDLVTTAFSLVLAGQRDWVFLHRQKAESLPEMYGRRSKSDEEIDRIIRQCSGGHDPREIKEWPRDERNALLKLLREQEYLSIRQIERITGISRGIIAKCGEGRI